MNKMILAAAAVLTAGAAVAQQAAAEDPGYTLYRRAVLGDPHVVLPSSAAKPADAAAGRWQLGDYALYLLRNGALESQAVAQARDLGESPRFVAAQPQAPAPQLDPYDLYRKAVVRTPDYEILRGYGASRHAQDEDGAHTAR